MESVRKFYPVPGGELSVLHFGDMSRPAGLIFLHATGFNALAYTSLLAPLAQSEDAHIIAIDMRGHGMTRLPAIPETLENWYPLRDDILAFLKSYTEAPLVIAGHSCGAVVSFLVAAKAGDKIKALVSFDPVTLPPLSRLLMASKFGRNFSKKHFSLARNAGKRRAVFDSKQAVFERYHGRGTFKHTPDAVLRDYIDGGFIETDAGVKLTCAPLWEQAIFVSQGHSIFHAAKSAPKNTKVIYAVKASPSAPPTRANMARILGRASVETHKDRGHFFVLEDLEFTRGFLRAALKN